MGLLMASNLLRAGHQVAGFDTAPGDAARVKAAGISLAASVQEGARRRCGRRDAPRVLTVSDHWADRDIGDAMTALTVEDYRAMLARHPSFARLAFPPARLNFHTRRPRLAADRRKSAPAAVNGPPQQVLHLQPPSASTITAGRVPPLQAAANKPPLNINSNFLEHPRVKDRMPSSSQV